MSEPKHVTLEVDTLLSNLLQYVPHTQTGLIERVTDFRMAAKRNGLYLLAGDSPHTTIVNPIEAYELGRRAGVLESQNNQTHAAFRLGEQQALMKQTEHPEHNLLGTIRKEMQQNAPDLKPVQIDAVINNMCVVDLLRRIGYYYGERKTD